VARKTGLTPEDAADLQQLYSELPEAAEAARAALDFAIETPTDAARKRYRECAARVSALIDRINKIRG